ncbi:hypothetical protein ABZX98_06905 [Streptomyces sp. NPDC002992]|uniref:hypothetical protein n=1 Tax=Streptomyces sp. NPDC002992 TaxID=3154273 RepID=UPI0033AC6C45
MRSGRVGRLVRRPQRQDRGEQESDGHDHATDVASHHSAGEKVAEDAGGAEDEEERADHAPVDAGDVLQDGTDEGERREAPAHQKERGQHTGPDGSVTELLRERAQPDGVARGQGRQQQEQGDDDEETEAADGGERDPPLLNADQGPGRENQDTGGVAPPKVMAVPGRRAWRASCARRLPRRAPRIHRCRRR